MGKKAKTGKHRLDKFYRLAKEQGFRSRAAFKLIQLNRKYGFLKDAKVLIDLCASPGGFLQVAAREMPENSIIVGVDLVPIKTIPGVTTFEGDITTQACRGKLRGLINDWKADVVCNDGAPNVGSSWSGDAFVQNELTLSACKLAVEFLRKGGCFVTKVFRSKDYQALIWVFNQFFGIVEATKPSSSRNESAEIFVVCQNFKAPDKIDPKLLDPKYIFQDLLQGSRTSLKKILNPEKPPRHREGYEDDNMTLFKTINILDFLRCEDPVEILASHNKILLSGEKNDYETIEKIRESKLTKSDILESIEDLKVLGKQDFKSLIRWRLKLKKELFKRDLKTVDDLAEVKPIEIDDAEYVANELALLNENVKKDRKRQIKKERLKKAKEMKRVQMDMTNQADLYQAETDFDLFSAKQAKEANLKVDYATSDFSSAEDEVEEDSDDSSLDRYDRLAKETDEMYEQYKNARIESNPKLKARETWANNDVFDPFAEEQARIDHISSSDSESEEIGKNQKDEAAANLFFEHSLFVDALRQKEETKVDIETPFDDNPFKNDELPDFVHETISKQRLNANEYENIDQDAIDFENARAANPEILKNKPILDTADAVELALRIVKDKEAVIDDSFNRNTFIDENLPKWFLEDENKHNKKQVPLSKEAVQIFRDKVKAVNDQPAKKELEAQMRKRRRMMNRAKKVVDQVARIDDDEDMNEKQKAISIAKVLAKKQNKVERKKKTVVVAKGPNRGLKKRPNGVKGKYKMVDRRLKKDLRAQKRIAKRDKKKTKRK
eukprot:NODE_5_length_72347_cov_1.339331.p5 type:complete len:781 gc:universal NODE_5_length_72347_cov_1.339331:37200-34858(-)